MINLTLYNTFHMNIPDLLMILHSLCLKLNCSSCLRAAFAYCQAQLRPAGFLRPQGSPSTRNAQHGRRRPITGFITHLRALRATFQPLLFLQCLTY